MNNTKIALKMFLLMTVITGLVYPMLITLIAQLTMPSQANGSLVYADKQVIGSSLIAQNFTSDHYFWGRPSAVDYNATSSGGSNLGPTSKKLKGIVEERQKKIGENAPAELVYASGSGLDPHISMHTAKFQVERIAKARGATNEDIEKLIKLNREGILHHYVNVLILNMALDRQFPKKL